MLWIGTAGWSIASRYNVDFPGEKQHLARYAKRMNSVEINSSFYRPHRRETYERWAGQTPQAFRFAVKLPKAITHDNRLLKAEAMLDRFFNEVAGLGTKLGPILVQLPPSLTFENRVAEDFCLYLRARFSGLLVCEPRYPSWFGQNANALLEHFMITRVAADPACLPEASLPGGWNRHAYWRLHGSPHLYTSLYENGFLENLVAQIENAVWQNKAVWCIFDNTAGGHALGDAMKTAERLKQLKIGRYGR